MAEGDAFKNGFKWVFFVYTANADEIWSQQKRNIMRGLAMLLFLIGTGAAMAGHIFIAWGIWGVAFLACREVGRRRDYWQERRELRDAYYRAYLRRNGYR